MAILRLQSVVAFPLGRVAIHLFHRAGQRLLPLGSGAWNRASVRRGAR